MVSIVRGQSNASFFLIKNHLCSQHCFFLLNQAGMHTGVGRPSPNDGGCGESSVCARPLYHMPIPILRQVGSFFSSKLLTKFYEIKAKTGHRLILTVSYSLAVVCLQYLSLTFRKVTFSFASLARLLTGISSDKAWSKDCLHFSQILYILLTYSINIGQVGWNSFMRLRHFWLHWFANKM